jgi:thiosulfate reductase cytochrome b subunit
MTHPGWLRVTHWINVVAFTLMIMSGWRIYNASPIFGAWEFPRAVTLGGWLGGALLWHFAAMWLLVANGAFYLTLGVATGRFRRQLFPLTLTALRRDTVAAVRGELSHEDISEFNAVQKLAYIVAIAALGLITLSGLVVFKSVQFPLLRHLLGGYDNARVVHFACMAILVAFLLVHVAAAALVPKTILAMVRGH